MILLSTSFINVDCCVFAVARPRYCIYLILHWNNKLFCFISLNLICGSFNISAFSKVVSIPLTRHNDCKWGFYHCIELLTHQKLQSYFLSMRFYMSQMSRQCPFSHFHFPVNFQNRIKKWKQSFWSTSWLNA